MEYRMPEPLEEVVTRESAPHRWTFSGQTSPWCDPISSPGPLYSPPNLRSGGLCPALMRDIVETLIAWNRLGEAAVAFEDCAPGIASLGRDDWNQWIRTIEVRLQDHLGRGPEADRSVTALTISSRSVSGLTSTFPS
jgi:hypothetical protein